MAPGDNPVHVSSKGCRPKLTVSNNYVWGKKRKSMIDFLRPYLPKNGNSKHQKAYLDFNVKKMPMKVCYQILNNKTSTKHRDPTNNGSNNKSTTIRTDSSLSHLGTFYWYQIFAHDSVVVKTQNSFSS